MWHSKVFLDTLYVLCDMIQNFLDISNILCGMLHFFRKTFVLKVGLSGRVFLNTLYIVCYDTVFLDAPNVLLEMVKYLWISCLLCVVCWCISGYPLFL